MNIFRRFSALVLVQLVLALSMSQLAIAQTTVTVDKVIELLELEVKEEKIIALLEGSPTQFTLGEDQIAKLKKAGASEKVIAAMQKKGQKAGSGSDVAEFIVILDASGSMNDAGSDGSKWKAAQQAAVDIIESIPNGRKLALIVYGHKKEDGCQAVEVLRPLSALRASDKSDVAGKIMKIRAVGNTPIALSLQAAMKELQKGGEGLSQVVLITDGLETCKGDPAAEAKKLAAMQKASRVDVIGYSLNDKESKAVAAIAESGNGKYYDAKSIKDLTDSVKAVKKSISEGADRAETTNMEAAEPVKASAEASDPAKLPFGKYVKVRLGNEKSHYWAVDLDAGDYQFVLEPKRSDNKHEVVSALLDVGAVADGQFTSVKSDSVSEMHTARSRLVVDYTNKEAGQRVVKVTNRWGIVDYVLGAYKKGKFSTPFLTRCPPVHKLKVGEEITTGELDGADPFADSEYYRVTIPAGDFYLDGEFANVDSQRVPCVGEIRSHTVLGMPTTDTTLFVSENAPSGKQRLKLILAEDREILFRVQPMDSKQTAKFKISPAGEAE